MAKFCNVCNQHYDDHEASCPHCAAAAHPAAIPISGGTKAPRISQRRDSEVDFDMPIPDLASPSGDLIPLGPDALAADSEIDLIGSSSGQSGEHLLAHDAEAPDAVNLEPDLAGAVPLPPASGIDLENLDAELNFDTTKAYLPDQPPAAPPADVIPSKLGGKVVPPGQPTEADPLLVPLPDEPRPLLGPTEADPLLVPLPDEAQPPNQPEPAIIPDHLDEPLDDSLLEAPALVESESGINLAEIPTGEPAAPPSDAPLQFWDEAAQQVAPASAGSASPEPVPAPDLAEEISVAESESGNLDQPPMAAPVPPLSRVDLPALETEPLPVEPAPASPLSPVPVALSVTGGAVPDLVEDIVVAESGAGVGLAEPVAEVLPDMAAQPWGDEPMPEIPNLEITSDSTAAAQIVSEPPGADLAEEFVAAEAGSGLNLAEPVAEVPGQPASGMPAEVWEDAAQPAAFAEPSPAPVPAFPEDASGMDFLEAVDLGGPALAGPDEVAAEVPAFPDVPETDQTPSLPADDAGALNLDAVVEPETPAPASGTAAFAAVEAEEGEAEIAALAETEGPSGIDLAAVETFETPSAVGKKSKVAKPSKLPALPDLEETSLGEDAEAAVAVEEPEEEFAQAEEEEEAGLAPKPKKPRYGRRWFAGGVLGMIFGAAIVGGLWMFGILHKGVNPVPQDWQLISSTDTPPNPTPGMNLGSSSVDLKVATASLKQGDFSDVLRETEKAVNPNDPQLAAIRGEARWCDYVSKQQGKSLNKEDPAVKQAIADLDAAKANNAEALFWRGKIEEMTGNPVGARQLYEEGKNRFPAEKLRFETAIKKLDIQAADKPAGAVWLPPLSSPAALADEAQLLAVLSIALQPPAPREGQPVPPPPGGPPAAQPAPPLAPPAAGQPVPPPAPGGPAAGQPVEAGFTFWNAVKLAQDRQYSEALIQLQKAREEHERLRFSRLRKAQNPISDPTEEIFLRCCDEMEAYWKMRQLVKEKKPELANLDAVKALETVLSEPKKDNTLDAKLKEVTARLQIAGFNEPDPVKGIDKLLEAKKTSDDKVTELTASSTKLNEVNKKLASLGVNAADPVAGIQQLVASKKPVDDMFRELPAKLEAAGIKEPDVAKGIDKLIEQRKLAKEAKEELVKRLIANGFLFDNSKDDNNELLRGIDRLAEAAKGKDPAGRIVALTADIDKLKDARQADAKRYQDESATEKLRHLTELDTEKKRHTDELAAAAQKYQGIITTETLRYKNLLNKRRSPQEMLPVWMIVLQDRNRRDLAAQAARDADFVFNDADASPALKAEALGIRGMALRNQGKFADARVSLEQALQGANKENDEDWHIHARATLKELTDPSNYFYPRAEELYFAGQFQSAMELTNEGLEAFPKNSGRLLALRSLVWLDMARDRARGARLAANDAAIVDARKDATDALAAGATAEGNFAAGRIWEELGRWADARDAYQLALKAHPDEDRVPQSLQDCPGARTDPHTAA